MRIGSEESLSREAITVRYVAIAATSGLLTGILAGLVGLGGAEERIPFILYGLKIPVNDMVIANLIISFGTSGLNFALRARAGLLPDSALLISLGMILGSVLGAFLGASLSHRVSERKLKSLLAAVLSIVVARISFDILGAGPAPGVALPLDLGLAVAVTFGFLIGVISGSVGVAGGEYRIPVLIFAFGLPIKQAGTASQLVSLPTIAVALWRHRNLGFLSKRSLTVAGVMGIPSIVGVALSQLILVASSDELIRVVFVAILLYTIGRILLELRGTSETPRATMEFDKVSYPD
jgi:uncharacterized membrane protein YfcA